MVWSSCGLGSGFLRQNLSPFHSRSPTAGGGCFSVQRLWNAVLVFLCKLKNCVRGICSRTMIAHCQGGGWGFAHMLYRCLAWSLFRVLLLLTRGWWWMAGGLFFGEVVGRRRSLALCRWAILRDLLMVFCVCFWFDF